MVSMIRHIFLFFEDIRWNLGCRYHFMLYGPYGVSTVIERMPSHFLIKYLRKYGATVGNQCIVERGVNIHRPAAKKPIFKNLIIGNNVYIGHKAKIDLSRKVTIHDHVIIGSRCMLWTHASYYDYGNAVPLYKEHYGEIEIFDYSLIYSGVIISFGIKIGNNVIIGAGSMVNRSLDDKCFYGGAPARFIRKIE